MAFQFDGGEGSGWVHLELIFLAGC